MPIGNEENIEKLIASHILGCLTDEEKQQLEQWINEAEPNRLLFERLVEQGKVSEKLMQHELFDTDQALLRFKKKLDEQNSESRGRILHLGQFKRQWAYAASLLLLLSLSYWLVRSFISDEPEQVQVAEVASVQPGSTKAVLITDDEHSFELNGDSVFAIQATGVAINNRQSQLEYQRNGGDEAQPTQQHILIVPRGGTYYLKLSDGTRVWLNAESRIEYPSAFTGEDRSIRLVRGEIYLEVSHDPANPFKVMTDQGAVTVLGTSFNVRNYPDENQLQTTLLEGKVAWSGTGTNKVEISLKPDQQLIVSKDSQETKVEDVHASDFVGWKSNLFEFHNQSLEYIMHEICRWYDCQAQFDQTELQNYRFSLRLNKYSDLSKLLNTIEQTNKINFELQGNLIVISE